MERSWNLSLDSNEYGWNSHVSCRICETKNDKIIRLIHIKKLRIWTFIYIGSTHVVGIRTSERVVQVVRSWLLTLNVAVFRQVLFLTNQFAVELGQFEKVSIVLAVFSKVF